MSWDLNKGSIPYIIITMTSRTLILASAKTCIMDEILFGQAIS